MCDHEYEKSGTICPHCYEPVIFPAPIIRQAIKPDWRQQIDLLGSDIESRRRLRETRKANKTKRINSCG